MTTTHELSDLPTDATEHSAHTCASGPAAGPCARPALGRRALLRGAAAAGGAVVAAAGLSACGHILDRNENVADGSQPGDMAATDMTSPSAMSTTSGTAAKQMSGGGSMDASKMPNEMPTKTPTQNTQMAPAKPSGTLLGMTSQVPVGGGVVFASHHVVVTQPNAGTYKAFSSVCTHAGCQCDSVASGMISCPCHGAAFSISDGSALQGPTQTPLPTRTVTVTNGEIRLQA
jgi:nitrite reductase/ring-hydroxylating ferredoxin subunit